MIRYLFTSSIGIWKAKLSSATRELLNLEPSTIQLRWIRKHNPLEKSDEFSNLGANLTYGKVNIIVMRKV
jgi:hypothetical protein